MDFTKRALMSLAFLLWIAPGAALAGPQVSLHLSAFLIQADSGRAMNVPLGDRKIAAGDRVRFVIEAHNSGNARALHLTPSDPIPAHMSYVPGSAHGPDATVLFSLDGKTFSAHPAIKVKTARGMVTRPADASMYRAVRWITHVALPAGHTFTYTYEAQVNGLKKGAK